MYCTNSNILSVFGVLQPKYCYTKCLLWCQDLISTWVWTLPNALGGETYVHCRWAERKDAVAIA